MRTGKAWKTELKVWGELTRNKDVRYSKLTRGILDRLGEPTTDCPQWETVAKELLQVAKETLDESERNRG